MKVLLDDVVIFINVIKEGSIVKASEKLSIPSPTISRRLTQLENSINGRLMFRSSRKIRLTALGQIYFDKLADLVEEFADTTKNLDDYHNKLSGTIRITAPISLSHQWFAKCIFSFMQQYPDIKIDLMVTNRIVDLADLNIDIAIRVGDLKSSDWIAKKLLSSRNILCASRQYLNQIDSCHHPADLLDKNLISYQKNLDWHLSNLKTNETFNIQTNPCLTINDSEFIIEAAKQGMGIGFLPYPFVKKFILNNELEQVLPDWIGCSRTIYLLFRDRNYIPNRVRVLKQYIENYVNTYL